ncbi:GGDEF domain-containing protein [Paraglaciecola hydrolytica]|nr:GGDEF domain-containing protein [Paraglaciecola hydrolytica]
MLLLISTLIAYHFEAPLIQQWLTQANWLPYACLIIAGVIAWQFGRSRLVWLSLFLLLIVQPIDPEWLEVGMAHTARFCFILLMLSWLILSTDKGFSPTNLLIALVTIALVAAACLWLLPVLASHSQSNNYLLTPATSWLFQLWPGLRQWFTSTELLITLLSLVLVLVRSFMQANNSQIALLVAWLSLVILHCINQLAPNQLVVITLAIIVCIAVIRDSFAMAFKDELTGIPSRRALMQYVQTLGRKYTLVMADIDHFKKFNDTYGHDVGDEVLKLVASKLNKVTGGGKAFRYGGEEFIMLFAGKSSKDVIPHVEAIRELIADYDIALRAKPRPPKPEQKTPSKPAKDKIVKVTTSFGVAEKTSEHSDFATIMKQADIALYAAKKAGRNCVKMAKQ